MLAGVSTGSLRSIEFFREFSNMDKTLRPDKSVQKVLISSTSRFVGEYEENGMLITHVWPGFNRQNHSAGLFEGPESRNSYIFVFETEPFEQKVRSPLRDYSLMGDLICSYLSLLFGKRFDNHGLVEGLGHFYLPDLSVFSHLCLPGIPQNSHMPRKNLEIPLNFVEFKKIEKLLVDNSLDDKFIRTLQSASKFYLQALQNFEQDPEIAYLHLITAGEILSNFFEYEKDVLLDNQIKTVLSRINDEQSLNLIKGRLKQVKCRFVKTIERLIDKDFFGCTESSKNFGALKADDFQKSIGAAYDLRSRYVHTGESFGNWISIDAGKCNSEVGFGKPKVEDKEYERILAKAPTYVGLERILRYCLLKFIHINGVFIDERLDDANQD